jgi:hypothetical protein
MVASPRFDVSADLVAVAGSSVGAASEADAELERDKGPRHETTDIAASIVRQSPATPTGQGAPLRAWA